MKCVKDDKSGESHDLRWKQRTLNLALLPWCLLDPKASIIKIFKNKIGKFDKDLDGIVISYKNIKVLQNFGCIRQDSAEINIDVQVDFLIFQPEVGTKLYGIINKKSVTHLSVLVHKIFNVVIPRPTDDVNFKWKGDQLNVGQKIPFTIAVVDLFGALPYIRGDLDESLLNHAEFDEKHPELSEYYNKLTPVKVSFDAAKPKNVDKSLNGNSLFSPNVTITDKNEKSKSRNKKSEVLDKSSELLQIENEESKNKNKKSESLKESTIVFENNLDGNSSLNSDEMVSNKNEKSKSKKRKSEVLDKSSELLQMTKNDISNSPISNLNDSLVNTGKITKHKDKRKKDNLDETDSPNLADTNKVKKRKRKRSYVETNDDSTNPTDSNEYCNKKKKVKLEADPQVSSKSDISTNNTTDLKCNGKKKKSKNLPVSDSDSESSGEDITSIKNKIMQKILEKSFSSKKELKKIESFL